MALVHSFEKSGNLLFKYRSYFPLLLFIPAIPLVFYTRVTHWPESLVLGLTLLAILLSLAGFLVRAWAIGTTPKGTSGRNTREQVAESLNITGIYSMLRHPLYLGNYLMWIGIVVFVFNPAFVLVVSLAFWLYYERIMFAEEKFLERKFGDQYLQWSLQVPAFFPAFEKFKASPIPFSLKSVLRREYSGVLATVSCFTLIDLIRYYSEYQTFSIYRPSLLVFGITLLMTLVLRSLKHHTRLLVEENRS